MHFYILAGGKSRRMGSNKALLRLKKKRVIEHVVSAIPVSADRLKIIANDPAPYAYLDLPVIPDIYPGCGPISGIHAGLCDCEGMSAFFLGCDLPFVSSALISGIIAGYRGDKAFLTKSQRGMEPLCGIYSRKCLVEIEERISRGEYGLQAYLKTASGIRFFAHTEDELFNLNTPEDFQKAKSRVK